MDGLDDDLARNPAARDFQEGDFYECCRGCYRATVNEPETITVAQPLERMRRNLAVVRFASPLERS